MIRSQSPTAPSPFPFPHPWANEEGNLEIDIAIVGGGAAGLYSAMRLAVPSKRFPSPRVIVFDSTPRLGGRVLSLREKDLPSALPYAADIGAMRFLPHQALIASLCNQFELQEKKYVHRFPTLSYFVRGRDIRPYTADPNGKDKDFLERPLRRDATTKDFTKQTAFPNLEPEERGLEPSKLIALGISRVLKKCSIDPSYPQKEKEAKSQLAMRAGPIDQLEDAIQLLGEKGCEIKFTDLSPYQWRAFKKYAMYDHRHLYQLGFWDIVQMNLSTDAFQFVDGGLGYQTIIGVWNAAEAIPWYLADFSGNMYESLIGGIEVIVDKMTDQFVLGAKSTHPGLITDTHLCLTNWTLHSVELLHATKGSRSYDLTFSQKFADTTVDATVDKPQRNRPISRDVWRCVRTKHVILAMSKKALDQLTFGGLQFEEDDDNTEKATERFRELIKCVSGHPLLKTFVWFDKPWWFDECTEKESFEKIGSLKQQTEGGAESEPTGEFATARLFTDMPLRMIYYHGPKSFSRTKQQQGSRYSMIMAYCDAKHAEYWDSLKLLKAEQHSIDPELDKQFESNQRGMGVLEEFGVTQTFAKRLHDQLWRYHKYTCKERSRPPQSVFAVYMNWSRAPFYGGWHSWKIDYSSADLQSKIMRPFVDHDIFVCGEAFSTDQGWIEGALKTAECMLVTHFGLLSADWKGFKEITEEYKYGSRADYCSM